jgi:quercetin dioxygenase-like cupin family protein
MIRKVSLLEASKVPFSLEGYIVHTSPTLEVIHLCLQPGEAIPQHTNPFDVVACLVEGEVSIQVEDNIAKLAKFDVVEVGKNINRGFTNTGTTTARLIIMKKTV